MHLQRAYEYGHLLECSCCYLNTSKNRFREGFVSQIPSNPEWFRRRQSYKLHHHGMGRDVQVESDLGIHVKKRSLECPQLACNNGQSVRSWIDPWSWHIFIDKWVQNLQGCHCGDVGILLQNAKMYQYRPDGHRSRDLLGGERKIVVS